MINLSSLDRAELAALVCETLKAADIEVVLVGGSCVCIYTNERFGSFDLDFIDLSYSRRKDIANALAEIGFKSKNNSRYFTNDECQWSLEFPSPPLAIGDEQIPTERTVTMSTEAGHVRLLSPTDCVKDRLLWWYLSRDRQCWVQALDLAENHKLRWSDLEAWHASEGYTNEYRQFKEAVAEQAK